MGPFPPSEVRHPEKIYPFDGAVYPFDRAVYPFDYIPAAVPRWTYAFI